MHPIIEKNDCSTVRMGLPFKREYEGIKISVVAVTSGGPILAGSQTNMVIDPGAVTVEEYKYGFSSDGGFTDSGFDVSF